MQQPSRLQAAVRRVQDLGIRVAIDDYGKGYSNLSRLGSAAVDLVKVDQRIIRDAATDTRLRQIIKSTIDMSHGLDTQVVLEGIEDQHDLDLVSDLGADEYQGFHFAKPMPLEDFQAWTLARRK